MRELSPRITTLLDHVPGMIYQSRDDPQHTLVYASNGCYALTGYQADDLIMNHVTAYGDLIHPDDREGVWINLQNPSNQQQSYELIYRIQTKRRQIKWVRERGRKVAENNGKTSVLEGFITDVTDCKLAEEKVHRQELRFQALRAIDTAIMAGPDLHFTMGILLEQIIKQLNVDAAAILTLQAGSQALVYEATQGFHNSSILPSALPPGKGLAGKTAQLRKTIHISNLTLINATSDLLLPLVNEGFIVYYGIPLIANGHVKGVLEVFQRSSHQIDEERLEFLEALAGQAAIAIDNSNLSEQLQDSNTELSIAYDATLEGWAKALELRDRETVGHAHRVIKMTLRIARRLGINGEVLHHIRRGAMLHDIGKMGIPDSILMKPGPLTPDEWEIMRQHPVHAHEMLKTIDYLGPALEIPYYHHERWDGSGYPHGLRGQSIPLSARIFAVADVWDALTSDRPYRFAWTDQQALEYIRLESDRHFDPQVVNAFFEV
jgi:PAS domain S-box-containing protein